MPTGNVTLLEAMKHGDEQLKRGVVETIIQESPLIPRLHWTPFAGTALRHEIEGTLPRVQFRNVNEGYSKSWGSDKEAFWGVSILGGEIGVDRFLEDVTATRESLLRDQIVKLAKSNSLRFDYEAIKGDGSTGTKGFTGVNTLIDAGHGQKLLEATGGGPLTLDKFDEAIDLFRNQGGPQEAWMNRTVRRKVTNLARTSVTGTVLIDIGTDSFGKKVTMYDDIPFVLLGEAMDGDDNIVNLLDYNEDPGDGTSDTTSVYFVKSGPDDVTGLVGKSGSMVAETFGELESAPQYMARLEWYPAIAIFNRFSIVRHYGITNA